MVVQDESLDKLRVLVTSGGTSVPIDAVRELTNFSMGTTGAMIAEEFLRRGDLVTYLHTKRARIPFVRELQLDPAKDIELELERIRELALLYKKIVPHLKLLAVGNFDEYRASVAQVLEESLPDAVISVAAVSDFGVDLSHIDTRSKLASDQGPTKLDLVRLPKIISTVRRISRGSFLVGFKLEVNVAPDLVVERAYLAMLRSKQDLTVANVGNNPRDVGSIHTYFVTIERGVTPVKRSELPRLLRDTIKSRYSRRHFRTEHSKVQVLPCHRQEVDTFLSEIRSLSEIALFPPYFEGASSEFGFVAKRTKEGTLITGRGSSKSTATIDDIALVESVDDEERVVRTCSTKQKASLNANLAHNILASCPQINYIVHAHITLPRARPTAHDTAPGTVEDWEVIKPLVENGERVIYQPGHGVVILLENLGDLAGILEENQLYQNSASHYDLMYLRFLQGTQFADLVASHLVSSAKILDLASGTGALSAQLIERDFDNITLMDSSDAMLSVAREKLKSIDPSRFILGRIEDLGLSNNFDGVTLRQAVNYLSPIKLSDVFSRIYQALKPQGKFFFNTFLYDQEATPKRRQSREVCGEWIARTDEGNTIKDGVLMHGQRSELYNQITGDYKLLYDLNCFYIHPEEAYETAIRLANFRTFSVVRRGRALAFVCEK